MFTRVARIDILRPEFFSARQRREEHKGDCHVVRYWHSLGCGHEEHSDGGKNEQCHTEGRGEKPHSWLFKLPCRAGEEEHGSEEDGVGEILAGAIARFARFGDPLCCISPSGGRFRGAAHLVKIRHEWVRVGCAVLEWLLREPGIVGFLHVRWKTLGIKTRELVVAGVLRREELHEHRGVNDQRLAALHNRAAPRVAPAHWIRSSARC